VDIVAAVGYEMGAGELGVADAVVDGIVDGAGDGPVDTVVEEVVVEEEEAEAEVEVEVEVQKSHRIEVILEGFDFLFSVLAHTVETELDADIVVEEVAIVADSLAVAHIEEARRVDHNTDSSRNYCNPFCKRTGRLRCMIISVAFLALSLPGFSSDGRDVAVDIRCCTIYAFTMSQMKVKLRLSTQLRSYLEPRQMFTCDSL
jgi:hypothetical protein